MDKLTKNWHWILILILLIISTVLYEVAAIRQKELKEQLEYQETKALEDSINIRKIIRQKDKEAFLFRDSLRQAKINYIKLQNEKQRVKIIRDIKYLPAADDSTKDNLWINSWATEDSLLF